jgi:hypothetical protein
MEENYVKIAVLDNEVEAGLLDSVLTEREIPHSLQSYHDVAYDGLFQFQQGWGCLIGPESRAAEVLEILADLRKDQAVEDPGDEPADDSEVTEEE